MSNTYLITFDLGPDGDYYEFYERVDALGQSEKPTRNAILLHSIHDTDFITFELGRLLGPQGRLITAAVSGYRRVGPSGEPLTHVLLKAMGYPRKKIPRNHKAPGASSR